MSRPLRFLTLVLFLGVIAPAQHSFQVDVSTGGALFGPPDGPFDTLDSYVFAVQSTGAAQPGWWGPPGTTGTHPAYLVMFMWLESGVSGAPHVVLTPPPSAAFQDAVSQSGVSCSVLPGHGQKPLGVHRDRVAAVLSQAATPGGILSWGQAVNPVLGANQHSDWKAWVTAWGGGLSTQLWMPTYVGATGEEAETSEHLLGIGNIVQQALWSQESVVGGAKTFILGGGLSALVASEANTFLTMQAVIVTDPPGEPERTPELAVSDPLRVRVRNTGTPGTVGLLFSYMLKGGPGEPTVVNAGYFHNTDLVANFLIGDGPTTTPVTLQRTWSGSSFYSCVTPELATRIESILPATIPPWSYFLVAPPNDIALGAPIF